MTLLDERQGRQDPDPAAPPRAATWLRDLAMGVRFAVGGGREGWVRTALTAIGVGLGVALLLGATSVPTLMDNRNERADARRPGTAETDPRPSDTTLQFRTTGTDFRGTSISGTQLSPDGSRPPLPPGVDQIPGPGEMVASPALKKLLDDPGSELLRERIPYKVVGTVGKAGLLNANEYVYYAGVDAKTLAGDGAATRIDHYGWKIPATGLDPVLIVLVIVGCVVLLMPVALFIGTAVRFGSEGRDRRLAALRLVGADSRMTRRIAAGETLFASLLGLVVGVGLFLVGRQFIGEVGIESANAFPSDLTPVPALAALIVVAVPAAAVAVTLLALRGITIEPLGVVRSATPRRRRLWWRLPVPLAGLALLVLSGTVDPASRSVNTWPISAGAVLVLLGVTILLPWLVEAVVARLKGGPVAWQLAVRRLQLSSGTAARAVSGITVAVAGAIALQMLFSSVSQGYTEETGQDPTRAQLMVMLPAQDGGTAQRMIDDFRATKGVRGVLATVESHVSLPGPAPKGEADPPSTSLTVGSCATLREKAKVTSCKDGDAFVITGDKNSYQDEDLPKVARPGAAVVFNRFEDGKPVGALRPWRIPSSLRTVAGRPDPQGQVANGLFVTTGALDVRQLPTPTAQAMLQVDANVPDALEFARNTAARIDPAARVFQMTATETDPRFASVSRGLLVASIATMLLIATSMLVNTLEQLRERRRLLSVLVAFGTRRATLGWSVLWQTALPVGLGLALAAATGLGLAYVLLRMVGKTGMDYSVIWPLMGTGAGLVLAVTLLSLPPLWRLMRPDGLRTE